MRTLLHRSKLDIFFSFFFARIGRSGLTRKLEKVGPFECDELEKHCRVSAKCYPTEVPALYTMTKEKFNSVFLVLLLVSRQTKSQLLFGGENERKTVVLYGLTGYRSFSIWQTINLSFSREGVGVGRLRLRYRMGISGISGPAAGVSFEWRCPDF